jgi:hypothetical protein
MTATTSIIQRIGPAKKPIEKPSNHKIKRIRLMTKSKVNILTSFHAFSLIVVFCMEHFSLVCIFMVLAHKKAYLSRGDMKSQFT